MCNSPAIVKPMTDLLSFPMNPWPYPMTSPTKFRRPSERTTEHTLNKLQRDANVPPNQQLFACLDNAPEALPTTLSTVEPSYLNNDVFETNENSLEAPDKRNISSSSDNSSSSGSSTGALSTRTYTPCELAAKIAALDPRKTGKVLSLVLKQSPQTAWQRRQDGAFDVDVSRLPRRLFAKLVILVELDTQGHWPHSLATSTYHPKRQLHTQSTSAPSVQPEAKRPKRQGDTSRSCSSCLTHKTPTWREVEGETFCNACALRLLKLEYRCPNCGQVPHHVDLGRCCPRCQGPLKSAEELKRS
eukprot:TRINITY_DN11706_c0_g1_i12.p2 TRINITY_DN11706_c0_g1~~TRINITY_DN11706_c0_g1_i12.p2  ORF type:complete len:301 (+),score=36.69 TRINITY_DN11706_c0_g1_i12:2841-3743(+)